MVGEDRPPYICPYTDRITELAVASALTASRTEAVQSDVTAIRQVLDNGLKDEVEKLSGVVLGTEEEPGLRAGMEQLLGTLHDMQRGFSIVVKIMRLCWLGLKYAVIAALAAGVPLAAIWAIGKYVLGIP